MELMRRETSYIIEDLKSCAVVTKDSKAAELMLEAAIRLLAVEVLETKIEKAEKALKILEQELMS